jgi:hypothetical protein
MVASDDKHTSELWSRRERAAVLNVTEDEVAKMDVAADVLPRYETGDGDNDAERVFALELASEFLLAFGLRAVDKGIGYMVESIATQRARPNVPPASAFHFATVPDQTSQVMRARRWSGAHPSDPKRCGDEAKRSLTMLQELVGDVRRMHAGHLRRDKAHEDRRRKMIKSWNTWWEAEQFKELPRLCDDCGAPLVLVRPSPGVTSACVQDAGMLEMSGGRNRVWGGNAGVNSSARR